VATGSLSLDLIKTKPLPFRLTAANTLKPSLA
jgi:hypothetical protein